MRHSKSQSSEQKLSKAAAIFTRDEPFVPIEMERVETKVSAREQP